MLMSNLAYHILVTWLLVILKGTCSLPTGILESQKQKDDYSMSKLFIPENNAVEENSEETPVFIMVPVLGDRQRRGIEDDVNVINFDNVSYEVPTFIKFNESSKGDIEVSLVPSTESKNQQIGSYLGGQVSGGGVLGSGFGGTQNNCCPQPRPNMGNSLNQQPFVPPCLTISMENVFPPGKCEKFTITNSSEIRGTGVLLKIHFIEAKPTVCPSEMFTALDASTKERLEIQKKKKIEEDDDEEEEESATTQIIDQKTLQEILFKILTGNKSISTPMPKEDLLFLGNSTGDPSFSFVINPSLFHKLSGKHDLLTTTRRLTTNKSLNPADFDSLLKTIGQVTSTVPKEKLLSLLTNLFNKATFNKVVSSNQ